MRKFCVPEIGGGGAGEAVRHVSMGVELETSSGGERRAVLSNEYKLL